MPTFSEALARRLGELWPLIAAGLPYPIVAWYAWTLRTPHADTLVRLLGDDRPGGVFGLRSAFSALVAALEAADPAPGGRPATVAALVIVFALAALGAALAATLVARGIGRLWLSPWPEGRLSRFMARLSLRPARWRGSGRGRLRLRTRAQLWRELDTFYRGDSRAAAELRKLPANMYDVVEYDERSAAADFSARRRNAIALSTPTQPTYMADQLAAVQARVRHRYALDLSFAWPRLWLLIPDHVRAELREARSRVDRDVRLGSWGILYGALGLLWPPAALLGAVVFFTSWRRARRSVADMAHLTEAAVDLYGAELASAMGVQVRDRRLDRRVGRLLTARMRKDA